MKIYRARIVYPICSEPLEDGAVAVRGDRILAVGKTSGITAEYGAVTEDLGEVILMPGLINAHCHLDYTVMRGAILPPSDFAQWIERINALKRMLSDEDYLSSIAMGFDELRAWGCTTVFNIESFPELMLKMPRPPLRTWWFFELLNVRNRHHTEDVVAGALAFFDEHPSWYGGFGLSPHAPYTASAELYQLARICAEKYGMPVTTHISETTEEYDMFTARTGTLFDFLKKLGRPMHDTGKGTPFAAMIINDLLPRDTMCVHMNFLDDSDFELIRQRELGKKLSIIHCPNCHSYFNRPPFPLARFQDAGIPVSIGTDSLASNSELNLFSEMRTMLHKHPSLSFEDVLAMVTTNPARAIGMEGKLGVLRPQAYADMIAIPSKPTGQNLCEAIVTNRETVPWMMIAGQRL